MDIQLSIIQMELSSKMWQIQFTYERKSNYGENYSDFSNISIICGWNTNVWDQEKEIEKVEAVTGNKASVLDYPLPHEKGQCFLNKQN